MHFFLYMLMRKSISSSRPKIPGNQTKWGRRTAFEGRITCCTICHEGTILRRSMAIIFFATAEAAHDACSWSELPERIHKKFLNHELRTKSKLGKMMRTASTTHGKSSETEILTQKPHRWLWYNVRKTRLDYKTNSPFTWKFMSEMYLNHITEWKYFSPHLSHKTKWIILPFPPTPPKPRKKKRSKKTKNWELKPWYDNDGLLRVIVLTN